MFSACLVLSLLRVQGPILEPRGTNKQHFSETRILMNVRGPLRERPLPPASPVSVFVIRLDLIALPPS